MTLTDPFADLPYKKTHLTSDNCSTFGLQIRITKWEILRRAIRIALGEP